MPPVLSITPKGKSKKFEDTIPYMKKRFQKGIRRGAMLAGQTVVSRVRKILGTGIRSGIKYAQLPNRSSAPGEPPRTQSGKLARSATYRVSGTQEIRVIENVDYAKDLEDGIGIKPRPHLIVAIKQEHGNVRKYLQRGPLKEIRI